MTWTSSRLNAQDAPVPRLTEDDLRRVVIRLYDLGSAWAQVDAQHAAIDQLQELAEKERAMGERELQLQKERTAIAERQRDLEKQRADFAEAKGKALGKGKGVGCMVKKVFSLGLARCG
jgi:hypothetical protein